METTTYLIDGKEYKMFTLDILDTPTNVASYDLNAKIEEMIEQERYHEIRHIDELYGYYLPQEVDETDEREVRESIEDVAIDYRVVYVKWDISDSEFETFVNEGIPRRVEIPPHIKNNEIENYLSDTYGYCVESYTIEI